MKRYWKRITAVALSGAMCLGLLGGCGDKESSQAEESRYKTVAQEVGYGFTGTYSELKDLDLDYINRTSTAQGKLYFYGERYNEEYGSTPKLLAKSLSDDSVSEVPLPQLQENTENSGEYVMQITVNPDGSGYWMVSNQYNYGSVEDTAVPTAEPATGEADPAEEAAGEDAPTEEAVPAQEETEDAGMAGGYQAVLLADAVPIEETAEAAQEDTEVPAEEETNLIAPAEDVESDTGSGDKTILRKCDMSGSVLLEVDLTEDTKDLEYFYPQAMAQDAQGNIYLASDQTILCYDASGTRQESIALSEMYVQSMVSTETGIVLVSGWSTDAGGMIVGRLENGGITKLDTSNLGTSGSLNLYGGSGSRVLLSDSGKLYSMDAASGQITTLLSWTECDINGGYISGVAAEGTDKILVLTSDYFSQTMSYELGTLIKTPLDQMPKRTVLTLGMEYIDMNFQRAVIKFNRNSDTYRVNVVDYSVYNTEEDYTAGADQLDRDIISGSCPDILAVSSSKLNKYTAKGALADMSALMEKDESFSKDSLLSGPLQFFQDGEKLYGLPTSFNLLTMLASAKLVGDKTSWTMAELAQTVESLPEGTAVAPYYTQADFLSVMVYQNIGQFVDYGTATCSFNSDTFKQLLQVASKLSSGDDSDEAAVIYGDDENTQLQRGDTLLTTAYVYDSDSIKTLYQLYTKDNGFVQIGFPTDGGSNGALLNIQNGLAISSRCKNQEGAWEFLKSTLADDIQESMWALPVTVSAFDKVLQEAMEPSFYTDADGNKVESTYITYIGETEYQIGQITQEQADAFKALVNNVSLCGDYDADVMDIVTEEAGAFFAGDKTADQVADLIQNRVTTYLGENS